MSESSSSPGVLYEVRWNEVCPWVLLVRSLRAALLVRVLVLAFVGMTVTQIGWNLLETVGSGDSADLELLSQPILSSVDKVRVDNRAEASDTWGVGPWVTSGPLVRAWRWLTSSWLEAVSPDSTWQRLLVLVLSGCWTIGLWAWFGGAICRIAALDHTRGEMLGPLAAGRSAFRTWASTTGAPLIALLGFLALAVPAIVAGLFIRWDVFALATGLAWGVVLAWGLVLAVVAIGLAIGWPLMWATMSVERSDAFDAVSRCYAYVYQRPLHLVFYVVFATGLGYLGEVFVLFVAQTAIELAHWAVSFGAGTQRVDQLATLPSESLGTMAQSAAEVIHLWQLLWLAIANSYPIAFLWTAAVGIYLLLRQQVDSTELDEISLDGQMQHELPTLEPDGREPLPKKPDANGTDPGSANGE